MSREDTILFQDAVEAARAGQEQYAYQQFCLIHSHGNGEDGVAPAVQD